MSKLRIVAMEDEKSAVKMLKKQLENDVTISANDVEDARNDLCGLLDYNTACINTWANLKETRPDESAVYSDLILKAENSNKKYRKLLSVLADFSAKHFKPVSV